MSDTALYINRVTLVTCSDVSACVQSIESVFGEQNLMMYCSATHAPPSLRNAILDGASKNITVFLVNCKFPDYLMGNVDNFVDVTLV